MSEIELKFFVPPERADRVQAESHRGSKRVPMTAVYFDSPDGCLAKAGVSLRLRQEDDAWVQTVKAPGKGPADREEHNAVIPGARAQGERLAPDLALHEGTPAGAALRSALGKGNAGGAQLGEVFRTEVVRHRRIVHHGGADVELALDEGEVVAGERRQPIHEIEFELKHGEPAGLFTLARQWVQRHGLWIESRAKADRGHSLARGEAGAAPRKAGKEVGRSVERAPTEAALLRALVDAALPQVLANASEVAAGRETPEHVHQLRVGLRRLRTALRAFGDAAPQLAGCEPAVAEVFRALGAWRDPGVMRESIVPALREAGALSVDVPVTPEERISPARMVRGTGLQMALLSLMEFAMAEPRTGAADDDEEGADGEPLDASIAARLSKLHKQVRTDGRRFKSLSSDEQHRVRKRLKRLRYLAEFVAPRFKRRAVQRYLAALEPAQDALGAHNDAVVARERFRTAAESQPEAWFAVGWLTARLDQHAAESHKSLKVIGKVKRFWR